jgi:hypothetical protein
VASRDTAEAGSGDTASNATTTNTGTMHIPKRFMRLPFLLLEAVLPAAPGMLPFA